jgi:regulator of sigma E protease
LPIGGFVKIYGEDFVEEDKGKDQAIGDHPHSSGTANAREGSEGTRSFVSKSRWAQAAVLIAGVAMNVLFAWFLFAIALSIGVQTAVDENTASEEAELRVTGVLPGSPAEQAGIPPGATITRIVSSGATIEAKELSPAAFSALVEASNGGDILVMYTYGGSETSVVVQGNEGLLPEASERRAIGVALSLVDVVSRPVHIAIIESFALTITSLQDITVGITGLLWDALRFDADLSQVAGPVGIVGLVGDASSVGLTYFLMFTAFISLNLAVINLLPIPALDGGRLLFVAVEAVKGSPIRPRYAHILNSAGFALLILLMIVVTFNDISRIIW